MNKSFIGVLALLAGLGITESGLAQETEARIDTIIIMTNGMTRTRALLPFQDALNESFPCSGGEMRLILSPSEQALFRDGRLIKYTYIANENTKQVAELEPPVRCLFSSGIGESFLSFYETKKHNHKIVKLHGIPCSIKYERELEAYRIVSYSK